MLFDLDTDGRRVASEASEGATVDAIDMVLEESVLKLLSLLSLLFGAFEENDPSAGCPSEGRSGELPDSRRREGITLPLIVCEKSLSLEYELMDIVRSSGLSGTTLP